MLPQVAKSPDKSSGMDYSDDFAMPSKETRNLRPNFVPN